MTPINKKWLKGFSHGFSDHADEACATDPDAGYQVGMDLWAMSSEEWRNERANADDTQGYQDGRDEALAQNDV